MVSLQEASHGVTISFLAAAATLVYIVQRLTVTEDALLQLLDEVRAQGRTLEEVRQNVLALDKKRDTGGGFGRFGSGAGDSWRRGGSHDPIWGNSEQDDYLKDYSSGYKGRGTRYGLSSLDLYGTSGYDRYGGDRYGDYGYDSWRYDDFDRRRMYSSYGRSRYQEVPPAKKAALQREFKNRTRALESVLRGARRGYPEYSADEVWRVPQILHQTWKAAEIPAKFMDAVASWRTIHPQWQFEFWDDARNRDLIAQHFPEYLIEYDRMSGIKKADVARIAFLYVYGGVYADIDVEAAQCFDGLLDAAASVRAGIILGEENDIHAVLLEQRTSSITSNAVMAGAKGHPFWKEMLYEIFRGGYCGDDPVECTGPRLLDRMSWRHTTGLHGGIVRLPYAYFSPDVARWNLKNMVKECRSSNINYIYGSRRERVEQACSDLEMVVEYPAALRNALTFAVHLWQCSWCRSDPLMKKTVPLREVLWRVGNGTVQAPDGHDCANVQPIGSMPPPRWPKLTGRRRRTRAGLAPSPGYNAFPWKSDSSHGSLDSLWDSEEDAWDSESIKTLDSQVSLDELYDNSKRGGCPAGYQKVDPDGREQVNWACCRTCPGGPTQCYNDCACACESVPSVMPPPLGDWAASQAASFEAPSLPSAGGSSKMRALLAAAAATPAVPAWDSIVGRVVALHSTVHGRYVRMESNLNVAVSKKRKFGQLSSMQNGSAGWERFLVVDAGNGEVALHSLAHSRYISMGRNRGLVGTPVISSRAPMPRSWLWHRFVPIEVGDGEEIALYSKTHRRFVRMNLGYMDSSDLQPLRALPSDWKWERFRVLDLGAPD